MTEKPPLWADLLLTAWVIVVGVVYFGGYFVPVIGALTGSLSAVYAIMVLTSALVLARVYLRRTNNPGAPVPKPKNKKPR